jgi:hypothetical protein
VVEGLTDAQIITRLKRLETAVAKLAEKAGVELDDPAEGIDPEVVKLARDGDRMKAAKLYAESTGVEFTEAQRVVADL